MNEQQETGWLPWWCTCPDDCDCDGQLVCGEQAGGTEMRCERARGHLGWHEYGMDAAHRRPGQACHRWDRSQDAAADRGPAVQPFTVCPTCGAEPVTADRYGWRCPNGHGTAPVPSGTRNQTTTEGEPNE